MPYLKVAIFVHSKFTIYSNTNACVTFDLAESKFTAVMPKTSKMQLKGGAVVEDQNLGKHKLSIQISMLISVKNLLMAAVQR